MNRKELSSWRRTIGMTQADAAKALGLMPGIYSTMESGKRIIPAWVGYAAAWIALFDDLPPVDDLKGAVESACQRLDITAPRLCRIFGVDPNMFYIATTGHRRLPQGVQIACAWAKLYGARNPFPASQEAPESCPLCGASTASRQ